MAIRKIHPQPIKLPLQVAFSSYPEEFKQNFCHIPGQAAIIRFFDPDSESDFVAMKEIVEGKQSRIWMDDARKLSRSEYRDWAGTHTSDSFLFAVHDARTDSEADLAYVHGFIYIYSEREEKFRVKRMEKLGFLTVNQPQRHALEVSFATRPRHENQAQQGSGLMSSGLRQSCFQVKKLIASARSADVVLFGFVDPENIPAQRTLVSSGFVKKGQMKYDSNSESQTLLYFLSWRKLRAKTTQKLREAIDNQTLAKTI